MRKYILLILFVTLNAQVWESSFSAGTFDDNNNFMGGSEVLQLVSHKNKLFASISYWQDESNIWYGGSNANIGWSQIISLHSPNEDWSIDLDLDSYYLRPEILKQVVFTKDIYGNNLSTLDTLLIAAAYSSNFVFGPVTASAFVRNDQTGNWDVSTIYEGSLPAGDSYSIRDMQIYTDQVTGDEMLLTSVGTNGIFVGKYNPDLEEKIQWNSIPEYGPIDIRPLGIVVANNTLYFSSGNKIYKRIDGLNPTYIIAHDFSDLSSDINSAVGGIRGLSVINNVANDSMLLMWCPNGQSKGTIFRLDPNLNGGFDRIYETKLSILVEDYLPGTSVNYLLGAYNDFLKIYNPLDNEYYHIVGFESTIQGGNYPSWNGYYSGALFAIRNSSAEYVIEEVNESISFNDSELVATRCYVQSPFNNENSIYFGGFDPNGFLSTNKAWIYKKIYTLNGDFNNDGVINILDVVQLVNIILINEYDYTFDMNEDGIVNILDIVQLVNIILTN
ncbi:dockerin type I domain-containing protein [Candidatus Marinimicrobia bacterium]|nr:dockerin type I domain-containing protein [Candidatus Neomarinimicrobiota bacterium]